MFCNSYHSGLASIEGLNTWTVSHCTGLHNHWDQDWETKRRLLNTSSEINTILIPLWNLKLFLDYIPNVNTVMQHSIRHRMWDIRSVFKLKVQLQVEIKSKLWHYYIGLIMRWKFSHNFDVSSHKYDLVWHKLDFFVIISLRFFFFFLHVA